MQFNLTKLIKGIKFHFSLSDRFTKTTRISGDPLDDFWDDWCSPSESVKTRLKVTRESFISEHTDWIKYRYLLLVDGKLLEGRYTKPVSIMESVFTASENGLKFLDPDIFPYPFDAYSYDNETIKGEKQILARALVNGFTQCAKILDKIEGGKLEGTELSYAVEDLKRLPQFFCCARVARKEAFEDVVEELNKNSSIIPNVLYRAQKLAAPTQQ